MHGVRETGFFPWCKAVSQQHLRSGCCWCVSPRHCPPRIATTNFGTMSYQNGTQNVSLVGCLNRLTKKHVKIKRYELSSELFTNIGWKTNPSWSTLFFKRSSHHKINEPFNFWLFWCQIVEFFWLKIQWLFRFHGNYHWIYFRLYRRRKVILYEPLNWSFWPISLMNVQLL